MVIMDVSAPVSVEFREAVSAAITGFLDDQALRLDAIAPSLAALSDRARLFTAGGKRLRPAFCAWGYAATGGSLTLPDPIVAVAASLDVLHVSALVHDDVMDDSDSRRGVPTAHLQFSADHVAGAWRGDSNAFGRAGAILLGDLLLVWSEEMLDTSGASPDALNRVRPFLHRVRAEVTAGQYLDVLAQAQDPFQMSRTPEGIANMLATIKQVVTYKSASYTVRRPLNVGAALAGASDAQQAALTSYGQPLGRAFQYRDDVLGVFGDEELTGKESGEDLREGKLTLLVAQTFANAKPTDAGKLASLFGRPDLDADGVDLVREIICESGALHLVEESIERETSAALRAIDNDILTDEGRSGLESLANLATRRDF